MEIYFPEISELPGQNDLVMVGGDLSAENLLEAYRSGYFPMPVDDEIGWFSPTKRAVLVAKDFVPSKSLKRSSKNFKATLNQRFEQVIAKCGDPSRPHGWISDDIVAAYVELHRKGIAHSVEVWNSSEELVGGLYGVHIGSLFAGESMFHSETDASKVALLALVTHLSQDPKSTIDAQWQTPHLGSLGFNEISRSEYAKVLAELI